MRVPPRKACPGPQGVPKDAPNRCIATKCSLKTWPSTSKRLSSRIVCGAQPKSPHTTSDLIYKRAFYNYL